MNILTSFWKCIWSSIIFYHVFTKLGYTLDNIGNFGNFHWFGRLPYDFRNLQSSFSDCFEYNKKELIKKDYEMIKIIND